jgi:hypothetical protein
LGFGGVVEGHDDQFLDVGAGAGGGGGQAPAFLLGVGCGELEGELAVFSLALADGAGLELAAEGVE